MMLLTVANSVAIFLLAIGFMAHVSNDNRHIYDDDEDEEL